MEIKKKIELLNKVLEKSGELTVEDCENPDFKVWRNYTERSLSKIYGAKSRELEDLKQLDFYYNPMMFTMGVDYSQRHLQCFREDFEVTIKLIRGYVQEFEEELGDEPDQEINGEIKSEITKVFISHASKDKDIVEELIDILETIGLRSEQIFCSSFEGYGIELGENFLQRIKDELDEDVLVIFVLSDNFYQSQICLCEMGATWIKTSEHIPVLIPPFDFGDVKGVIPLTQGFKINEPLKLNLLKKKIEQVFDLNPLDASSWERKRDRIIKRLKL